MSEGLFVDTLVQKAGSYSEKIPVFSELGELIVFDIFQSEKDLGYRPTVALYEGMLKNINDFANIFFRIIICRFYPNKKV